jgi:glycosyltransferase involved in cell wall biosynthesis
VKRHHILTLVSDLFFGGDETRLLNFARTVDRRRFRHTIVTIRRPDADPERSAAMRQHYAEAGIDVEDLGEGRYPITLDPAASPGGKRHHAARPGELISSAAVFTRSVGKLRARIREREVDLLDARGEVPAAVAVTAGKLTRTPTAITCYHTHIWNRVFMRLPGQFSLGFGDVVITDSRSRAELLKNWTWRRRLRVVVIPNGVYYPQAERTPRQVRAALGLPSDENVRVVGQVGRIVARKGHLILLEAARAVLAEVPDVRFLIVGWERPPGANRDALMRRAVELGIADKVIVASYPGSIGDVWSLIDIHVHASLYDSLPVAIQEGMSLGKPAVVTSVGGIPEMVENEKTGLVVPPGDSDALAGAILRLLADEVAAERLGRAAAQRYQERYRPEVMTRAIEDLFLELIGT